MKIQWSTVWEITIGVLIAGIVITVLNGLFGNWIAAQGEKIHGTPKS